MAAVRVARMDVELADEHPDVVNIEREVFGRPRRIGGPQWVLNPPHGLQRAFWSAVEGKLPPNSIVFVARGMPNASAVRDAHEQPIPGLERMNGPIALFFIDDQPLAEWSHACRYAFVEPAGVTHVVQHDWPVSERIELVPASQLVPASP